MSKLKEQLASTSILQKKTQEQSLPVRRPHITEVNPTNIGPEHPYLSIRGSSLQGNIIVSFKMGDDKRDVPIIEADPDGYLTKIANPQLKPGVWTLQLKNEGGESNPFPITFMAPAPLEKKVHESSLLPQSNPPSQIQPQPAPVLVKKKLGRKPSKFIFTSTKTVKLPDELWKKLKHDSVDRNMTLRDVMLEILYNHYKRNSKAE